MSALFFGKMFELHIEAFHSYKRILSIRLPGRCLFLKWIRRTNIEDALIGVKSLYV